MARLIHTGQALVDAVIEVPELPRRGGNAMATALHRRPGGAVTILVAAARSGASAVHAGSLGTGPEADLIRTYLDAEGVEVSSPPVPHDDTGVCIVLVEPDAERTFVTTTGAERCISVDSLATSRPVPGDMVCVTGYSLALELTRDPLLAWLEDLPDGVEVILDPGAAFAGLDTEIRARMLALTTVWTGNAEESAALGGVDSMVDSLEACAAHLPPGAVVITRDGPNGCAVLAEGKTHVVPGFPRRPVDTNGAGDTHTGAMLAARLSGADWPTAARWSNAAAAIAVTRPGPDTAPATDEITTLLTD